MFCSVEGCDKPVDARGLCHGHYQRFLRNGDVAAERPLDRTTNRGGCSVPDCNGKQYRRKLCKVHYSRLRRFGDVQAHIPPKYRPGTGGMSHGYRKVPVPKELRHLTNGETPVAEHRLVMAMELGRPLHPDESVHHKNGIRTDNRIENLELWSRWQPSGCRIEDQVAYAIEVLKLYDPQALAELGLATSQDDP